MKSKTILSRNIILVLTVLIILSTLFCSCNDELKAGERTDKNNNEAKDKTYKIGILSGLEYLASSIDGFKEEMERLGYIEGKNIEYQIEKVDPATYEIQQNAVNLIEKNPDLIYCFPTEATLELQKATKDNKIPIVFGITNIEGTDIVESVKKPGGNITGVRYPGPDLALKRIDAMLEIVPDAKKILLPFSDIPVVYPQLEELRPYAEKLGIELIEAPAKTPEEFKKIFEEYGTTKEINFDAIVAIPELYSVTPDTFLSMVQFANEHKIPVGGAYMNIEGYASLFGVNIDAKITGKNVAILADKILKGGNVAEIPVLSDETFIEIDVKETAKQGLEIPEMLLDQASKIYK